MRRWIPLLLSLTACSGPSQTDLGPEDMGAEMDQGAPPKLDMGEPSDAGAPDQGSMDTGAADAGAVDAGTADTGALDLGAPDAGTPDMGAPMGCQVSVCMAGAFTREDAANPIFERTCAQLPGIVEDCAGGQCYSMFAFSAREAALEGLIAALDTNQDNLVDASDEACEINLLGYSWGGVNTTLLAGEFLADMRVAPGRAKIERMVALDPYSPLAGETVEIVAGVQRFWSYRHTASPAGDCSAAAPLGPYQGLPPLCDASVQCTDYDYSLTPNDVFNGYTGAQIGHCTIVEASDPAILHNLTTGQDYADAPTSVPVGGL